MSYRGLQSADSGLVDHNDNTPIIQIIQRVIPMNATWRNQKAHGSHVETAKGCGIIDIVI